MNTYWINTIQTAENLINDLANKPIEEIDFEIEWTVLGLLRQFYTLQEYNIVSKMDSGKYGLLHMPVEWHSIIEEAINIRKGVNKRSFVSEMERVETTLRFSKYLIRRCNNLIENNICN
ncbi:aminoglycoside adenylyltransferase domain-containing protein [Aquibacillus rhizosphaerae]|uniref:DUF4111 domain-containing protein n=1 Tax=Aquibacillus rhizosphaerae TaxID=3051431 RepID=A0ABT7L290_9BACI|nr:aminoglycoside adenylyltransferase domain-containing protein [Aquibacillus sp. LR5S19]MDL4839963.1 DUF4111 domain-containing protein [Aquibacillus sp. LR5S19]